MSTIKGLRVPRILELGVRNGLRNAPRKIEHERGSVTVEFALVFPLVVLLLGFALSVQNLSATHSKVQDHARQAARLASMGVAHEHITSLLKLDRETLTLQTETPWVTARVSTSHRVLGLLNLKVDVDASAVALLESELASWP